MPLGERRPEFRRPNSNYYGTRYLEARATARMLVELGIHDGIVDIVRGDSPDVIIRYGDGREIYVEQAMVLDEGAHRFSLGVEEANAAVWELAKGNSEIAHVLDAGMLTIRTEGYDLDRSFDADGVAREIASLAPTLKERVDLMRADPARYPLLAAMDSRIFYRPGAPKAGPISTPAFHGRMGVFDDAFRAVLAKKISRASGYPATCEPLWLLLTVDMHFGNSYFAKDCAEYVLSHTDVAPYDRVLVQIVGMPPLVAPL